MQNKLIDLLLDPYPLRTVTKQLIKLFGNYELRLKAGVTKGKGYGYPNHARGIYDTAVLAKKLNYPKISVIEYGVGGGNGLINMEYHAREVAKLLGVEIEVYGFDLGDGLPRPVDYRDLPSFWKQGFCKMDVSAVKAKLKTAKLILGPIQETSKDFFEKNNPAPIGFIAYDLDFYSSTMVALKMLEAGEKYFLPRMFCYFDDTVGSETELFSDFTGERWAIREFNLVHPKIKFSRPYYLFAKKVLDPWFHRMWICHFFEHSRYNDFVNSEMP